MPDKIDKIYVINLEWSKLRRERIDKELKAANLEYEIYNAVDGSKLEIIDESGRRIKGSDISNGRYKPRLGETYKILCPTVTITYKHMKDRGYMNAGALGCQCSHLELMRKIAKNGEKFSIILEDDAKIYPELGEELERLKGSLITSDWDVIYLGLTDGKPKISRKIKYFRPILFNSKISKITAGPPGTQAYVWNSRSAEKVLAMMLDVNREADTGQIDSFIPDMIKNGSINGFFSNEIHINQHGHENRTYPADSNILITNAKK